MRIPNQRTTTRIVALPMIWETPLRTGNLRDPNGPQVTFAFESFIDELAAAAKADPVQFRLEHDREREGRRRVPQGALARRGRARRRRPMAGTRARRRDLRATAARGKVLTGRGIAYTYRSNTIAAVIAEVEVNRETGRVWVKRMVCAHDCGLVINPEGLRHTVECGMLHALSRALWEEVHVRYGEGHQRRLDLAPQPAPFGHAREDRHRAGQRRPEAGPRRISRPYGAGETSHKPVIAAVANAIYDAHRRAAAAGAVPQRAGAGSIETGNKACARMSFHATSSVRGVSRLGLIRRAARGAGSRVRWWRQQQCTSSSNTSPTRLDRLRTRDQILANRHGVLRLQLLRERPHASLLLARRAARRSRSLPASHNSGVMVRFGKLLRAWKPLAPWHTEQCCVYSSPPCAMT